MKMDAYSTNKPSFLTPIITHEKMKRQAAAATEAKEAAL